MITGSDLPPQRFVVQGTVNVMDSWFAAWAVWPSIWLAMLQHMHADARRHLRP